MVVQELSEFGNHELGHTNFDEQETCGMDIKNIDIWEDTICMGLLREGILPDIMDLEENKRARKKENNQLLLARAKVLLQGFVYAQTRGENGTCNPNA